LVGWKNPLKQRNFFNQLAKSKGFDPLDARKWCLVKSRDVVIAVSFLLDRTIDLSFCSGWWWNFRLL
jgi:hypothetical protein